jgi:hypothetical protein
MHDEVNETEKRLEMLGSRVAEAMKKEKEAFAQRADKSWASMKDEYLVQANLAIKEGESAITRGDGYYAQLCQKKAESYLQRVKDLS